MTAMKVLIADDEPIALQVLREMLDEIPGIEIVGEAATGTAAVEQARRLLPDVLLLDLQMPGMNGFQVAGHFPPRKPVVIFVTAYDKHALEAFDAGAVDYLLKPVRRERLKAALTKARAHFTATTPLFSVAPPIAELKKVVGRSGTDLHLLDLSEVVAFQADGEVVYVNTAQGRFYADDTLKGLEQRLPAQFRRVHRGAIINTDHIRRISPLSSKRWLLRMSNGLEVIVSKRLAGIAREGSW
jgi:DNA-binding LytR/AlgR family response regulator